MGAEILENEDSDDDAAIADLFASLPVNEVDPVTEVFMDIMSKKFKVMAHLHKEDDAILLIQLSREFGLDAIANHCMDIYRKDIFSFLNSNNIPIIYGPLDCFPYKVELKHESWKM